MTVGRASDSQMVPEPVRRAIEARRAAEAVAERNAEEEEAAARRARNEALARDLATVIPANVTPPVSPTHDQTGPAPFLTR